jgi:hypothetical protein
VRVNRTPTVNVSAVVVVMMVRAMRATHVASVSCCFIG